MKSESMERPGQEGSAENMQAVLAMVARALRT